MSEPEGRGYRDTPLRSYVLTGGRAAPSGSRVGVDTLLTATPAESPLPATASPQQRALLRVCGGGVLSVAEAAAHLDLPISVVRILVGDLVAAGRLRTHAGAFTDPGLELLKEVLDGLRDL
ncbi:DUF742 domain-containing protein [Actinomadura rugatobispora]|uniref:DUF742 domain-containing protein n=1 Tax=Actinomadura rugatobispora TaxID=1994 RepID=A0ABW1A834_9ACTN|nr:DUF742 domain-containing protein [Actinomadura rugatobispora]